MASRDASRRWSHNRAHRRLRLQGHACHKFDISLDDLILEQRRGAVRSSAAAVLRTTCRRQLDIGAYETFTGTGRGSAPGAEVQPCSWARLRPHVPDGITVIPAMTFAVHSLAASSALTPALPASLPLNTLSAIAHDRMRCALRALTW